MFLCCCFEQPMVYHARSTSAYSTASTPTAKNHNITSQKIRKKVLIDEKKYRGKNKNSSSKKIVGSGSSLHKIVEDGKNQHSQTETDLASVVSRAGQILQKPENISMIKRQKILRVGSTDSLLNFFQQDKICEKVNSDRTLFVDKIKGRPFYLGLISNNEVEQMDVLQQLGFQTVQRILGQKIQVGQ